MADYGSSLGERCAADILRGLQKDAGEQEFADMKRRMGEIASFRPYRKKQCRSMVGGGFLIIAVILMAVHTHSDARCNESKDIMVGNYDGNPQIISYNTEELS